MTSHRSERVRVLAVTADPSFASSCERHLGDHDHLTVTTVETVGEAIERLAGDSGVDCIVSDHDLPDTDGLAFLEAVRTQAPMLPLVLFTSEGNEEIASHAISADVTEYLIKGRHDDQWDRLATLVVDAVDYHRSRQDLFDPETRATTLLDAANDMITVVRDGHCEYVNATGLDLLALDDRTQAAGHPIESWLSPPDGRDLAASLATVQSGDQPVEQFETTLTTSEDRELSVEVTATRVRWSDGPATVLVVRDIDDRRADEQMLRQFRRAVEAAGHAIYMTDPDGTITYVNPAFEEMTGYDSDDVLGKTPAVLSSGTMSEEYYEDLWSTITSGDVWEEEIRDRRQSGALYYAHQTIAPLTDDDGEVVSYVAIQNDTTEQRRRESQLRQYEHAIEGASELIAAVDHDYQFLFANESYRQFHGMDPESVTETRLIDLLAPEQFEAVEPYLDRGFEGETVQFRATRTRSGRSDHTFNVQYTPLTDESGTIQGLVATMRDVTEQVEREQQLASLDRLLRHNLHNALNVIRGRAEIIDARASKEVAELAAPIEDAVERLLTQANKEREIVELLTEPPTHATLDLTQIVTDLVAELEAEHADAEIAVDVDDGLQLTTAGEIERAIRELVENAVVHSDRDHPEVSVVGRQTAGSVEITVTDDGPGIPAREREVITEDSSIEPLLHSSGMGLWLVKRIVTAVDGTLQFDDAEPRGSVVTLVVPGGSRAE
ncbi:PAS domain-containing protein (plasmid) [Halomicrobium sp. IBSBa]|uniref:PAS domain-containing protein n=1 Tax=Halomicrobium sp. IBSBa TaxID=2778916 RepID=UPI001ABF5368|nr:PAS domain-containing protein [Halomicrobium sp. IBSBa]MBO4248946.1 PAS domain-containing protein [Halomicrobium sp. IBSBa]